MRKLSYGVEDPGLKTLLLDVLSQVPYSLVVRSHLSPRDTPTFVCVFWCEGHWQQW